MKEKELTQEARNQIEVELTESMIKINEQIGEGEPIMLAFNKLSEHFRNEFRRLKTDHYHSIERDKEAQAVLMNEYNKLLAERDKKIEQLHKRIDELNKR